MTRVVLLGKTAVGTIKDRHQGQMGEVQAVSLLKALMHVGTIEAVINPATNSVVL